MIKIKSIEALKLDHTLKTRYGISLYFLLDHELLPYYNRYLPIDINKLMEFFQPKENESLKEAIARQCGNETSNLFDKALKP